jgi:hypothetical protein
MEILGQRDAAECALRGQPRFLCGHPAADVVVLQQREMRHYFARQVGFGRRRAQRIAQPEDDTSHRG